MPRFEVQNVPLIPQEKDMSCWYASAQMLIHWKMQQARASLRGLVPPALDAECRRIRDDDTGIGNSQILAMAQRLGLRAVPPMSPTPAAIEAWLRKYGPLWVNGTSHIVVISGIDGMKVRVHDPWPPKKGAIDWRGLAEWYAGGTKTGAHSSSTRDTSASVPAVFLHCP